MERAKARRGAAGRHLRRARGVLVVGRADAPRRWRRGGHAVTRIDVGADLGGRDRGAARLPRPTWCSTRCTAGSARTAASRACWTGWAFPTRIRACAPRRSRWTRRRPRRPSRRPGCRWPRTRCSTPRRWKRRTPCRCPTWSSRWRRAPPWACTSCARATTAAPSIARGLVISASIIAEPYIPGRELTVAVMGDRALAVTEITAAHGAFYDYEAKYGAGGSRHVLPAAGASARSGRRLWTSRCAAHRALGCRGVSRADFRYDDTARRAGTAGAAGGEHPARHDADLARAGAGGALRHSLRGAVRLDGASRRGMMGA